MASPDDPDPGDEEEPGPTEEGVPEDGEASPDDPDPFDAWFVLAQAC